MSNRWHCQAARRGRRAFTLVELLVVISIIGVLMALLLPAVQAARESGRRTQCSNNLKQLGLGIQNFHDNYGLFPPVHTGGSQGNDRYGTWFVVILPYIEQQNLYNQFDLKVHWDQGNNPTAAALDGACLKTYQCPSRRAGIQKSDSNPQVGATGDYAASSVAENRNNYQHQWQSMSILRGGMIGAKRTGAEWKPRTAFADIRDGTSNTVFVGEKHVIQNGMNKNGSAGGSGDGNLYITETTGWWECHSVRETNNPNGLGRGPFDTSSDPWHMFGSWHPGICQFLFGDGSVRGIVTTTSVDMLRRLGDRSDGESVTDL